MTWIKSVERRNQRRLRLRHQPTTEIKNSRRRLLCSLLQLRVTYSMALSCWRRPFDFTKYIAITLLGLFLREFSPE
ncbi:hypothetical protein BCR44DRAFT_1432215 [Catenaria anguillulae PL171]|uniref:Uncharacterized protein n=1 Tax=Catenaria anguillulae PL171 TaxID=765915 RepID=A0A1Y2HPR1_9FUNG|nr:hypothetical protein BCR44DRAFT_1432215 [Catenaria anguillulae PL171]